MSFFALPLVLCCAISRMVFTDSCLAESINEHVFTTITSASSALFVISAPALFKIPIITSLSTRFLGQPRLTNPTFFLGAFEAESDWGGSLTVGTKMDMQSTYFSISGFDQNAQT